MRALLGVLVVVGASTPAIALPFDAGVGRQVAVRKDYVTTPALRFGFYVYLPRGYVENSGTTYPLVIFLHGSGEKGNGTTQLGSLANTGLTSLMVTGADGGFSLQNLAVKDAIVISPQTALGWSNPAEITPGSGLDAFIGRLLTEFDIDPNRIYLTGWSLGSGGTYDFTRLNPGRIAAMAPMSGPGGVSPVLLDIPLWAFHHQNDPSADALQHLQKIQELTTPANGSVRPPPPTDAFLVYRKGTDQRSWRDGGTIFDDPDPTITLRFSWLVSAGGSLHASGWKLAYASPVFWNWMLGQTKSGTAINRTPIITATSPLQVTADTTRLSIVSASDPDGQPVTLGFDAGTATFVTFSADGGTGQLTASPTAANLGSYVVSFTASDSVGGISTKLVAVDVVAPVITVSPASFSTVPMGSRTLTATARDAVGAVIPGLPSWAATDGGTITSGGVFTAGARAGTFPNSIRATMGAGSGTASVTIASGAVAAVNVVPSGITIAPGGNATFIATAKDAFNNLVSGPVTWAAATGAGVISDAGVLTAGSIPGAWDGGVSATVGSVSGRATVVIQVGALADLRVTPNTAQLGAGGTTTFTATGRDANGNPVAIVPTWSVLGGGTITQQGVFTAGPTPGRFADAVVVEASSLTAFASVEVLPGAIQSVVVTPRSAMVPLEGTQQFTAEARDTFGNPLISTFTWSVTPAAGTIDSAGLFTAASNPGDFPDSITATASSVSGVASVTLVGDPPIDAGSDDEDAGLIIDEPDAGEDGPDAGEIADGGALDGGSEDQPGGAIGGCGCGSTGGISGLAIALMLFASRRSSRRIINLKTGPAPR